MGDTPGFHDFVQRAKDMNRLVNSSGLRGARGPVGGGCNSGSGGDLRVPGFEPESGSVLTARSLEPASDSVSPLSLLPSPALLVLSPSSQK